LPGGLVCSTCISCGLLSIGFGIRVIIVLFACGSSSLLECLAALGLSILLFAFCSLRWSASSRTRVALLAVSQIIYSVRWGWARISNSCPLVPSFLAFRPQCWSRPFSSRLRVLLGGNLGYRWFWEAITIVLAFISWFLMEWSPMDFGRFSFILCLSYNFQLELKINS
jgi:hypothetical protein